jgi:hypothetical protein
MDTICTMSPAAAAVLTFVMVFHGVVAAPE